MTDADLDRLARAIWQLIEQHTDPEAGDEPFTERDWDVLLIESERDEYRKLAARAKALALSEIAPK